MKSTTQSPNAKLQLGQTTRIRRLVAYLYTLLATPFMLGHCALDILLCLPPWTRPTKEWSVIQAVRMRVVRLVLLYWSFIRWGDRLTLRPGRERNRFEVMHPPSSPSRYCKGVLSDPAIQPSPIGTTWTPARPPPVSLIRPELSVALHFHGGGFAIGNGRDSDTGYLAQTFLTHMGCALVCTPQYRLSSQANNTGRFPAPLQDALTAYLWLIYVKRIPAKQIIVSGDSAGANIAIALMRYIAASHSSSPDMDIPAPGAVALWSPWVDVEAAIEQDMRDSPNYATDYLNREFGRWGAASVSGFGAVDLRSAYLSPLHHPFAWDGAPPMFVHGGDREVLWDDIQLFAKRYEEAGWKVHLHNSKHCPHDILLLGSRIGFEREAEEAARDAGSFFLATAGLKLRRSSTR